ncbi:MAG: hypothetical protein DRH32_06525 [Deltaproteobacteria bacterium]|nr:MAG: hypothetical protein DRH32_06525 [Deltaproteobacteria bacterium]
MKKLQQQLISVSKTLATLLKKVEKITAEIAESQPVKKAAPAKKITQTEPMTVLDTVYEIIRRSRNGATIAKLKEKTLLNSRQISNAVYKLSRKGKIVSKARGVYIRKK